VGLNDEREVGSSLALLFRNNATLISVKLCFR
jgi:hypothetical protein